MGLHSTPASRQQLFPVALLPLSVHTPEWLAGEFRARYGRVQARTTSDDTALAEHRIGSDPRERQAGGEARA
jgi:hypothetical protein